MILDSEFRTPHSAIRNPQSKFRTLLSQPTTTIVVTFDRLPATFLSCYGNEWIETQNFDRLAAQAAVFEEHYAEIPGPAGPNHPWWTGRFEYFRDQSPVDVASHGTVDSRETAPKPTDIDDLIRQLDDSGVRCRFVSERAEELPTLKNATFEIVGGSDGLDVAHTDTPFARLIDRGIELMREDMPQLIWLHSRGVPSPWLASRVFAELYFDELEEADESGPELARKLLEQLNDDETLTDLLLGDIDVDVDSDDAVEFGATDSDSADRNGDDADVDTEVPDPNDSATEDAPESDESLSELGQFAEAVSRFMFAGYVSQLDHLFGRLLNAIESIENENSDRRIGLVVTSAAGQAFAEREAFVSAPSLQSLGLTEQVLLTPLIVRITDNDSFGHRIRGLVQPVDLLGLLEKLTGQESKSGDIENQPLEIVPRSIALHFGPAGELGIRDSDWFFSVTDRAELKDFDPQTAGLHDPIGMLFVKPDDQHDVNNVVAQGQGEATRLISQLLKHLPN